MTTRGIVENGLSFQSATGTDNGDDAMTESSGDQDNSSNYGESCLSTRRGFIIQALGVSAALFGFSAGFKADADTLDINAALEQAPPVWRFCDKCYGLFTTTRPGGGRCPVGGGHRAAGYVFVLGHGRPIDAPAATSNTQNNWRFCDKCYGLFFNSYSDNGRCPAGGGHHTPDDSDSFILWHDAAATSTRQADWRFCTKCYGLFFDGSSDNGRCPAGGGHTPAGYNFVLSHQ